MKAAKALIICVAQCVFLSLNALSSEGGVVVERGLPEYFGASLDDVARVIAKSDAVFEGVVQVNGEKTEGRAINASGEVICQRELLVRGKPLPRSVPFVRDISQVAISRGESSATAPFYLWGLPMNGAKVIAFARQDDGDGMHLLKVIPLSSEGVPELLDALALLASPENHPANKTRTSNAVPTSSSALAEKVQDRWRENNTSNNAGK